MPHNINEQPFERYVFFSYGGINLTVFESQIMSYVSEAKKRFKETHLIVLDAVPGNFFRFTALRTFIHKYAVTRYIFLFPFVNRFFSLFNTFILYCMLPRQYLDNALIHCRTEFSAYVVIKLLKLLNIRTSKVILDVRADVWEEIAHSRKRLLYNKNSYLALLRYSCKHADLHLFVTTFLHDKTLKYTRLSDSDIRSIINPVIVSSCFRFSPESRNSMRATLGIPSQARVWIYVGGLNYWQNPAELKSIILEKLSTDYFILLTRHTEIAHRLFSDISDTKFLLLSAEYNDAPDYLSAADADVIIRNNSDINKAASPVKLAEYLSNGLDIYSRGDIGLLHDLPHCDYTDRIMRSEYFTSFFTIESVMNKIMQNIQHS
jgi:hypothetical protein